MLLQKPLMMNSSLAAIGNVEQLQVERRKQANTDYLAGLKKLKEAQEQGFSNKTTLRSIYEHWSTAVRKHRKEPRYLSALAYILILLGEQARAGQYVAEALQLDPEHAQAKQLQQSLQQLGKMTQDDRRLAKWSAFDGLPWPAQSQDYDGLYDQVQAFIQEQMQVVLRTALSPSATFDPQTMAAQEQLVDELNGLIELVDEKLEILDQELELLELEHLCKPLKTMQSRFQKAVGQSKAYQQIWQTIHEMQQDISAWIEEAKNNPEALAADPHFQMELILDMCDSLADQLDGLSEEVSIQPLEPKYEALVKLVETLQDALDD